MPHWWNGRHVCIRSTCLGRVGSSPTWGTMKRVIIEYKNFILKVNISEDNTCILDSYKVQGINDMLSILHKIQEEADENSAVNKRGICGMIHEWRTHNLLYSLNIQKDRTRSVDLNLNQPWYVKVAYSLLSPFYLHF